MFVLFEDVSNVELNSTVWKSSDAFAQSVLQDHKLQQQIWLLISLVAASRQF